MNNLKLMSCLVTLGLFGVANAEEANVPEILRDGIALADELMVRPEDRDTTDTAIVASNMGPRPALVICSAFNANAQMVRETQTIGFYPGLKATANSTLQ